MNVLLIFDCHFSFSEVFFPLFLLEYWIESIFIWLKFEQREMNKKNLNNMENNHHVPAVIILVVLLLSLPLVNLFLSLCDPDRLRFFFQQKTKIKKPNQPPSPPFLDSLLLSLFRCLKYELMLCDNHENVNEQCHFRKGKTYKRETEHDHLSNEMRKLKKKRI